VSKHKQPFLSAPKLLAPPVSIYWTIYQPWIVELNLEREYPKREYGHQNYLSPQSPPSRLWLNPPFFLYKELPGCLVSQNLISSQLLSRIYQEYAILLTAETTLLIKMTKLDTRFEHFTSCRFRNEKWRNRCVLGAACMIIGLEMGGGLVGGEDLAMAREMQVAVESKEYSKGPRWSDKRMCPPWSRNSLETIVPENLPRPSAHRRWEEVGFSKNNAPAVKVIVIKRSNGCFSM